MAAKSKNKAVESRTIQQFDELIVRCKDIYVKKTTDYGTAWRVLRPKSLTDQIFIKAKRIRTIEELETTMVNEGRETEFLGIVNYCIMALIQLDLGAQITADMPADEAIEWYDQKVVEARDLLKQKNHDYGDAWRSMRVSSITDLILMKLLRTKQIEDNEGKTLISEGIAANYLDILIYAIFALIRLEEPAMETN